jgi:hypothetical protein
MLQAGLQESSFSARHWVMSQNQLFSRIRGMPNPWAASHYLDTLFPDLLESLFDPKGVSGAAKFASSAAPQYTFYPSNALSITHK